MANIQTTYMGLKLNSPIIISSSGLSSSLEKVKQFEEFGAGAIVLKSLFEEQIMHEAGSLSVYSDYPEAVDYLNSYITSNSVESYLDHIKNTKSNVKLPIIASINCTSASKWVNFAKRIQDAGADAIEINVFFLPTDPGKTPAELEETYYTLAEQLSSIVTIPIAFKLGSHFTNPLRIIEQLWFRKVNGIVLFNRFFEPDFDIEKMKVISAEVFSNPAELRNTLRWVGMASQKISKIDISASTGVHSGEAVIKCILAGASSVQACSVFYKKGPQHIAIMNETLKKWMEKRGYKKIDDFKGHLNYGHIGDPAVYERSQFMKYFSNFV